MECRARDCKNGHESPEACCDLSRHEQERNCEYGEPRQAEELHPFVRDFSGEYEPGRLQAVPEIDWRQRWQEGRHERDANGQESKHQAGRLGPLASHAQARLVNIGWLAHVRQVAMELRSRSDRVSPVDSRNLLPILADTRASAWLVSLICRQGDYRRSLRLIGHFLIVLACMWFLRVTLN